MGATKKNGSYFNTCSMVLMLILHKIQENVRLSFVINCEFEFYGFKHFKIMYVEAFPHLILLTPQPIFFLIVHPWLLKECKGEKEERMLQELQDHGLAMRCAVLTDKSPGRARINGL